MTIKAKMWLELLFQLVIYNNTYDFFSSKNSSFIITESFVIDNFILSFMLYFGQIVINMGDY